MNKVIILTVLVALASQARSQTCGTYTCPSTQYTGYTSTAYTQSLSPLTSITAVNGVTVTATNGIYYTTCAQGAASAAQCCATCAKNPTCTTWTYNGCGNCYLSSSTSASNYLIQSSSSTATSCGYSSSCTPISGFIPASSSSGSNSATTTTTIATPVTVADTCFVQQNYNAPTPTTAANQDTIQIATSLTDCCNRCGNTAGCQGFAFQSSSGGCWLKSYNPFGTATPAPVNVDATIVTGIVTGTQIG